MVLASTTQLPAQILLMMSIYQDGHAIQCIQDKRSIHSILIYL